MKGIKEYRVYGEGKRYFYIIGGEEYVDSFPLFFPDAVFVSIVVEDWNRYLSPYKGENPFKKDEAFLGEGEILHGAIEHELIPLVEKEGKERYLIGYSMGGLFALYSSTLSSIWKGIGSVSGSLWYDGFDKYMESHQISVDKVYLSLGRKEKESRNKTLKSVFDKTNDIFHIIKSRGMESTFVLNEGGHFQDEEERIKKAISFLAE